MEFAEEFQKVDSDASKTFPKQCSTLRKGEFGMIKRKVCKIVEMKISKTGKHGHAKVHLIGIDVFTGKKYEEIFPGEQNVDVPTVDQKEYQVVNISRDGYVTLMDTTTFQLRSDLKLPESEIGFKIKESFDKDQYTVLCTVVAALNEEKFVSVKTMADK